jgi:hypothetical protein
MSVNEFQSSGDEGLNNSVEEISLFSVAQDFVDDKDVVDDSSSDTTTVPIQYDITSFGADYDVEGLVKRLKRGDIVIPSFQRDYVWNIQEASRFIESLLLGLPVPGVFLARETDSNKLLVIDGQQRLKTLQFFYDGVFNPHPEDESQKVFRLSKVQDVFDGKSFEDLETNHRLKLNDSIIHATIVKQDSPSNDDTSIYHIFERLNSGGRRLTPHEIRVVTYHGALISLVKDINENHDWRQIFGAKNNRLKDQELILRFFALYYTSDSYARPMNEFLNKFAKRYRNSSNQFLAEAKLLFSHTVAVVLQSIGKKAFRPERAINAAVFDSVMVGLARRLAKNSVPNNDSILTAYEGLLSDRDYRLSVFYATSDEKNVANRLRIATEAFAGL